MNKYRQQSREAQVRRRLEKKCLNKTRYDTPEAAYQKGQQTYFCHHCHGWHRSGQLATLLAEIRKGPR